MFTHLEIPIQIAMYAINFKVNKDHAFEIAPLPAWTMECLTDDYYVPGACLCAPSVMDDWWRQVKAWLQLTNMALGSDKGF